MRLVHLAQTSLGQDEQPHVNEKSLVERDLGIMLSHDLKWVS